MFPHDLWPPRQQLKKPLEAESEQSHDLNKLLDWMAKTADYHLIYTNQRPF